MGSEIVGLRIEMDGKEFRGITFRNCTLVYSGGSLTSLNNTFLNCQWIFEGPAGNTLNLISQIYQEDGGDKLIEKLIKGIRLGAINEHDGVAVEKN